MYMDFLRLHERSIPCASDYFSHQATKIIGYSEPRKWEIDEGGKFIPLTYARQWTVMVAFCDTTSVA